MASCTNIHKTKKIRSSPADGRQFGSVILLVQCPNTASIHTHGVRLLTDAPVPSSLTSCCRAVIANRSCAKSVGFKCDTNLFKKTTNRSCVQTKLTSLRWRRRLLTFAMQCDSDWFQVHVGLKHTRTHAKMYILVHVVADSKLTGRGVNLCVDLHAHLAHLPRTTQRPVATRITTTNASQRSELVMTASMTSCQSWSLDQGYT